MLKKSSFLFDLNYKSGIENMISGISHITLIVKDIEKTAKLFISIFDAEIKYLSGLKTFSISPEIFLLINGVWIALMQGEPLKERTYNHVAFKTDVENFAGYVNKIKAAGVEIKESRSRIKGEADSIYFYDYDNHLFEIHSGTLEQRLNSYSQY